ncbi:hypothetical protein [Mucilaginibacter phyllosphaerae]|uniref:Uncharacterized protein n=1 Tax=Mucilaginibacter phyllosphaerae TaxID=1812349 RepID=A0A4Y8AA04_9SPHI|nr:hypothetical protein [Mucilaginibacter phyllosphaerae]MBB3969906.1 hypothetical protein [Mucilaginibacter phyllosphaerae]TEW65280.1 hypothetical protein E2R65_15320 [Mucilaginibacter phyllosphaerae]GGH16872.1 hypothetical protein GCM10007352_26570 [Mucilaginibacter phyllosphaerae]
MNAHELAQILLQGEDLPVVIPALEKNTDAEIIENISILQNDDSPFEYSIFLEGKSPIINEPINIAD